MCLYKLNVELVRGFNIYRKKKLLKLPGCRYLWNFDGSGPILKIAEFVRSIILQNFKRDRCNRGHLDKG